MKKIIKKYKEYKSKRIEKEGIYYDYKNNKYIVENYTNQEKTKIGEYKKLKEAYLAKETYEKAIKHMGK